MSRCFWSLTLVLLAGTMAWAQAPPCCSVTAIDARTGVVSAKVNATAAAFQFSVTDKRVLAGMRVGQGVYANFAARQVSLDGRTACCRMTAAATPAVPGPAAGSSTPPGRPAGPAAPGLPVNSRPVAAPIPLPAVSAGAPHPPVAANIRGLGRFDTRTVSGGSGSATLLHLRGLDAIEQAQGLPDGARRLLAMHVRTLPAGDSNHYIVNPQLAQEWALTHPVPPSVKPSDTGGDGHSGCKSFSWHCAEESAKHAEDEASRQAEELRKQAQADWNHAAAELTHDWNMVADCMADHTLPLPNIPVQFQIAPGMQLHLEDKGSKDLGGGGSASGKVQGTVGLSFPMQGDFRAQLDLFYIPCLPFVVRARSLSAAGTMTVGERLTASASATGKFDKTFTIPPTGGPRIPIEVIPIIIGGVPVAELDVSAYIEGNIEVGGQGQVDGHFQLDNPHEAAFDFTCSGKGCQGTSRNIPDPTTATEGAELKGQVFVKPDIFTALQLDFDVDALSARAGPQPYLLGTTSGCAAASASQTVGGASTSQENHALTADLDWGVDLRAEALVGGQRIGQPFVHSVTGDKHLWFRDLAPGGSNALMASVGGPAQVSPGRPVQYQVKMPSCYPYTNPVQYRLSWTGGAKPAPTAQCQWQSGQGFCTADPTRNLTLAFSWPASGNYSLSVVAVGDNHHRSFSPAPQATQVAVTVKPAP